MKSLRPLLRADRDPLARRIDVPSRSRETPHWLPIHCACATCSAHASIVTTERYDNQQLERLQVAAGKLESGKLFEAPTGESGTDFHISCTTGPTIQKRGSPAESDDGGNSLPDQSVEGWLGGRDSNPDNVVQSHVSYR